MDTQEILFAALVVAVVLYFYYTRYNKKSNSNDKRVAYKVQVDEPPMQLNPEVNRRKAILSESVGRNPLWDLENNRNESN